ncbi:MAG: glycerol-3-phosphate 1-O-acyltransferase PlsY [Alphaproteobacteria bacterium]|nr:glycerol-3-phosphate 1-O-acyltransferase PlsY [Alphaproteobacteria bacterium]
MSLILTQIPVPWLFVLLAFLFGYLSGSVPYGLLLGKMAGIGDIRKTGSGNIGATNVLRVGGKKLAILTLLLDGLKGTIPVLIAGLFHTDYAVITALGAFIGHLFSVWLKFKGGKGVAVALGITFALSWEVGILLCLIWLVTAMIGKYSSLSALTTFALAPFVAWYFTVDFQIIFVMSFLAIMIWVKHHANIKRLLNGTESKINIKKTTS